MRTTLTVDDDVLLVVQERARREHRSVGAVLSELARRALTEPVGVEADVPAGFPALPRRGTPVSRALVERLLEDEPV